MPSKTRQKVIGTTGDAHALDHGGGVVADRGYGPEWWFWDEPEQDDNGKDHYKVYRVPVEEDVFGYHSWADPFELARTYSINAFTLQALGSSPRVMERVEALEMIAGHYGPHELDNEPDRMTRAEMERFFGPTFRSKRRR